jgi:hypothetical protein
LHCNLELSARELSIYVILNLLSGLNVLKAFQKTKINHNNVPIKPALFEVITMNRNNPLYSRWKFYVIGIVTLPLLLTSCMMHEKYNPAWGELIPVKDNRCPDISGIYSNTCGKHALTKILGLEDTVEETHVQITQLQDGTFEISGWNMVGDEQKLVYEKSYPKRKYSCTPEGISASSFTEGISTLGEGLGGLGIVFGSFYLLKNADGDLVVKETGTVIGFAFIFPIIGFGSEWHIFPREDLKKE